MQKKSFKLETVNGLFGYSWTHCSGCTLFSALSVVPWILRWIGSTLCFLGISDGCGARRLLNSNGGAVLWLLWSSCSLWAWITRFATRDTVTEPRDVACYHYYQEHHSQYQPFCPLPYNYIRKSIWLFLHNAPLFPLPIIPNVMLAQ